MFDLRSAQEVIPEATAEGSYVALHQAAQDRQTQVAGPCPGGGLSPYDAATVVATTSTDKTGDDY